MPLNIKMPWKPGSSLGKCAQIAHRMFSLLIFVRQQHSSAYLHYRLAQRGAFPKPSTHRLISSYSLLSPHPPNGSRLSQRLFFRITANCHTVYSHNWAWMDPIPLSTFPSFTVLALNHAKKTKAVIYKPVHKRVAENFSAGKKMRIFCACFCCGKQMKG